jgi:DNA/RNA-binding domain of Phe-tRNA-synthetase-like protein
MSGTDTDQPLEGWCSPEVARELPGLRLLECAVEVARRGPLHGDSPPDVRARLAELANRVRGARAVSLRREPIPSAYRVFFRHIGIDPDARRTPLELAMLERMMHGGFPSRGLLADVLLIALLDTGVPVWALDEARVHGPLGIRTSVEGERFPGERAAAGAMPAGRLVVADAAAPIALLFGEPSAAFAPHARSSVVRLFALQVQGVPPLYVEESLWSCQSALQAR